MLSHNGVYGAGARRSPLAFCVRYSEWSVSPAALYRTCSFSRDSYWQGREGGEGGSQR